MPQEALRQDFETLRDGSISELNYEDDELDHVLADCYKVSLQAMLLRLLHLKLISGFIYNVTAILRFRRTTRSAICPVLENSAPLK